MKTKWLLFIATGVIGLIGVGATASAQQGYNQILNCPCYSTPQYQTYESVPQPYYNGHVGSVYSEPIVTYQSPHIGYGTVTSYPSQVYGTFDSGQIVHSDQVYYGNASPAVVDLGYSAAVSSTSYPVVSAPVYSSREVYHTPTYSSPVVQTSLPSSYSPSQVVETTAYSGNYYTSANPQPGLAQQKADQAAQMGFRDHVGGSLGGAKFEGVGWSNQSPQLAIQNCCYWGQRSPAQIGVSKSHDGCWYACVLYH